MPTTQAREIIAASRLDNVRYAIRDLACVADEVIQQGHKVLPLNVGDPPQFRLPYSSTHHRSCLQGDARGQEWLCSFAGNSGGD